MTTADGTRFVPMLDLPPRQAKPRRLRRTVIFDRGWPHTFIEGVLDAFPGVIDIAKISAWHLHQTEAVVTTKLAMYKRHGVETMGGGPVLEIARLQHKEDEVLDYLQHLGFDALEVSSESMPTQTEMAEDAKLAEKCLERGFRIHGEVGKKFPGGDQIRTSPDVLDVDTAVRMFEAYREMGCDGTYLEGHVLRSVLGDMAEKVAGRDSIVELVERVGLEDIIFEIPGTFLHYAGKRALQGLLVYLFGPDVNMANILIEEVMEAEELRDGTFPAFGVPNGDHPWIRSAALSGTGIAGPQWWRG